MDDDPWDYEDNDCWNCSGEGYIYGCSWDWQCDTWDGDSCLCTRRCDFCNPPKSDPKLQEVLRKALTQGTETGTAETEGLGPKDDGPVGEADAQGTQS